VAVGKDCGLDDVVVHDEKAENATMAYLLSRMMVPQFPEVFGVLRQVSHPTYEESQQRQIDEVTAKKGKGDLDKLFRNDDLWVVE
jgi:2-oxoglutarate ferredoxin oxidoreductase subunit beta